VTIREGWRPGNLFFVKAGVPWFDDNRARTRGVQGDDIVAIDLGEEVVFGAEVRRVLLVVVLSALVPAVLVVLVWHLWK
jgi:hypothetical protein